MMKSRNKMLLIISIFMILFFGGVFFIFYIEPLVKQNQLHSDFMFLDNVTQACIRQYYESNQEYPKSLSQIENKILEKCYVNSPPKDSKYRELLNNFQVFSDKKKLVLSWQIQKKDVIYCYTTVFENGKSRFQVGMNNAGDY